MKTGQIYIPRGCSDKNCPHMFQLLYHFNLFLTFYKSAFKTLKKYNMPSHTLG